MAVELVTKFSELTDEKFTTESKVSMVTNKDYDFDGAKSVKVYNVTTAQMHDYGRERITNPSGLTSLYGNIEELSATTQTMTISQDRSFTFVIDAMDEDETGGALSAATALSRQLREVCIPEYDKYVIGVMAAGAGIKPDATTITKENVYLEIIKGTKELDEAEVLPEGRVLLVSNDVYFLMKQSKDIEMETEIGQDMKIKGVISTLDGMPVVRVPSSRLPENFGFMIAHPCATVAPEKLQSYLVHANPPGISGTLVEGRIYYDAFVLQNKKKAIYYATVK